MVELEGPVSAVVVVVELIEILFVQYPTHERKPVLVAIAVIDSLRTAVAASATSRHSLNMFLVDSKRRTELFSSIDACEMNSARTNEREWEKERQQIRKTLMRFHASLEGWACFLVSVRIRICKQCKRTTSYLYANHRLFDIEMNRKTASANQPGMTLMKSFR